MLMPSDVTGAWIDDCNKPQSLGVFIAGLTEEPLSADNLDQALGLEKALPRRLYGWLVTAFSDKLITGFRVRTWMGGDEKISTMNLEIGGAPQTTFARACIVVINSLLVAATLPQQPIDTATPEDDLEVFIMQAILELLH